MFFFCHSWHQQWERLSPGILLPHRSMSADTIASKRRRRCPHEGVLQRNHALRFLNYIFTGKEGSFSLLVVSSFKDWITSFIGTFSQYFEPESRAPRVPKLECNLSKRNQSPQKSNITIYGCRFM